MYFVLWMAEDTVYYTYARACFMQFCILRPRMSGEVSCVA